MVATLALVTLLAPAFAQEPAAPHVVFVVGEGEYQSQQTMPALAERLEDSFGWRTTVLLDEELHTGDDNHVEGLDALDSADLVVLYLRFRRWPQADLDALTGYVERGGHVFGFRTSTHAFNYDEGDPREPYNDFGADVLGAPWIYHYGHDSSTHAKVVLRDAPVLDGVDDEYDVRSWTYHVRPDYPPKDATVLVTGTPIVPKARKRRPGPEAVNPVAWTRTHAGGGRVFMTTMGHPEDFHVEPFRRLVGNGMHWALGLDVPERAIADFPEVVHPDDVARMRAPWRRMDYGPFLSTAISIGDDLPPVHKGIVMRLRDTDGEPTDFHAVFDTNLLALRCIWRGEVALRGIVFDGPHGTFPEIDGDPVARIGARPGVVVEGREERAVADTWGPVPDDVGRWHGVVLDGDDVILQYEAHGGAAMVRERLWVDDSSGRARVVRELSNEPLAGGVDVTVRLLDRAVSPSMEMQETVTLGASSVQRIVYGGRTSPLPRTTLSEALAGRRPRWGDPIETMGELRLVERATDVVQRLHFEAGETEKPIDLVRRWRPLFALEGPGRIPGSFIVGYSEQKDVVEVVEDVRPEDRLGNWAVGDEATERERNTFTGEDDLRLDGVTWRRGIVGRALDFDGTAAAWPEGIDLDFARHDATVAAWIQTTGDGTVFSRGPREGDWAPDGVTLFLRDGKLSFDVGWVGVVTGGPDIADGAWHHVAATWRADGGAVRLFVDGVRVADGELELRGESTNDFAPRFGWTNDNFPNPSRFGGYMEGPTLLRTRLDDERIEPLAAATGERILEATVVVPVEGAEPGATLDMGLDTSGTYARLVRPEGRGAAEYEVRRNYGMHSSVYEWARRVQRESADAEAFRIDRITWPAKNRFHSWMRFGAFDFVPTSEPGGPTAAMITTWSGDVWRVDGLDDSLEHLRWRRYATGLNQPFGLECTDDGRVLVLGRDQITELFDHGRNGEADAYRSVSNVLENSEHFHEPASGLTVNADGSYTFIKAARHAKRALHDHHGAVVRVSADGSEATVLARGFRAPIGLTVLDDGTMLGSDQEGHWTPANRINLIRPDAGSPRFYGNGWAASPGPHERDLVDGDLVQPAWPASVEPEPPLCWIHPSVDRSPSSQLVASHPAWGPLQGQILGLSYGTGDVYLVLREDVANEEGETVTQGGIVKLGLQLPTGLLHGRIHPTTGDLYVCGLFGWSSDRTNPGGFFRVRPNASSWPGSLNVPTKMRATRRGLELTFLGALSPESAEDTDNWSVTAWNYRRASDYGSPTFDLEGRRGSRSTLRVRHATLSDDGRTVSLEILHFEPCMQLDVAWDVVGMESGRLEHSAHLTVHALSDG